MPARQNAPLALKFFVATIFLGGLGFGALAALAQPDPRTRTKPVEVAKVEPSKPAPKPEPKAEPTPEPKKPAPKPEPPKVEPQRPEPQPEPKKPEVKPEPPKPEPKKPEPPKPEEKKPEPPKSAVTFQQVQKVLKANCVMCHGDPLIRAKIDLRTLDSIKKKPGLVEPGKPDMSDLWGSIEAGTMPPPDAKTKLNETEKKLIKEWIASGAK
jgi:hypothetical protein